MKKILVTGAGGGMGAAICRRLLNKGYEVFGIDCRMTLDLPGLNFFKCDVTDSQEIAKIKEEIGEVEAIVHTAGIYDLDSLLEIDEERLMGIFNVNLFGVYRVNREFAPLMNAGGRIIIITSELAPIDPLPFTGIYAVTKAALDKYAYSLRMEVNLRGIKVSVIRPGAVDTGLLGDSTDALDRFCSNTKLYPCNADRFKGIVEKVEARKISPEKLADVVIRAVEAQRPRLTYSINRNPLLLMLNVLPGRMQLWVIKQILKNKK